MNRYELAMHEVQSVLAEWLPPEASSWDQIDSASKAIVDRLVAKGVIQSTVENDLKDYRTGPLEPGRKIVGRRPTPEELAEAREWRKQNFPGISDAP